MKTGIEGLKEPMESLAKATGNEDVLLDEDNYLCVCDDTSCPNRGEESLEVMGHITSCTCQVCHQAMGKI